MELSWVYTSPKAFSKVFCYYGAYKWPKFFFYPSGDKFLVSFLLSSQSIVSLVAEFHLIVLRCFFHNNLSLFVVGVPTTPFDPSPKDAFLSSFVAEAGIFFSILFFSTIYLLFLSSGGIVMLFSSNLLLASPFYRSVVSSLQVLSSYQVLPLFSARVLSEIFLTPCAILSIVPKAVCCWFHQVSSHLVKFMFNSLHLQSECCPNYINLIPSLSSFNRSGFNIYLITKPLGSRRIPCASFLIECFQLY